MLARAKVPRDAWSRGSQEVDAHAAARSPGRPTAPMNPASVMKLVTTYAGAGAARPGLHLDHAGLAEGTGGRRRAEGNLVIQGRATPSW